MEPINVPEDASFAVVGQFISCPFLIEQCLALKAKAFSNLASFIAMTPTLRVFKANSWFNLFYKWRYVLILGAFCRLNVDRVIDAVSKRKLTTEPLEDPFSVPGPETLCRVSAGKESKEVIYIESTGLECLTPRQACGIESAARANPEMSISVHVNTMRIGGHHEEQHIFRPGRVRSCALNEMLADRYNNVHFIKENFLDLLRASEFWPLIESRKIQLSPWSDVQVSDAVRLILLYKSGGIYLDFDNVVFRPLHCLKNTLSYLKEAPNIENGIMVMDAGHPFLKYLIAYLSESYDAENRVCMGPPAFGKAFQSFCKSGSRLESGLYHCADNATIELIDPDAFFPVKHNQNRYFYSTSLEGLDLTPMTRAYLTHVYLSSWGTVVHQSSLYARLAMKYCPSVWRKTTELAVPLGF